MWIVKPFVECSGLTEYIVRIALEVVTTLLAVGVVAYYLLRSWVNSGTRSNRRGDGVWR